ncbi:hypothetical protein Tco_0577479 [Tanacetum coccineum]
MANAEHAPAMASPVRTDEQIVPRNRWVPIGKSNCYLNEEKSQPSPIFKIAVDILKQTNFFRAFTASSTIPAIYIQQFWDTICFDSKAGSYKCQLDEQWFNLTQDTLRDALQITPVDNNRAFSSPPTPDTLVEFVNKLGYPKEVIHLSNVTTNDMFQPWRALTTIINLCLTGKTSGFERPRAPVLQILWGVVNQAHIDYAERMWEEFTQSIHTFTEDKRKLAQHTLGKKKATLILIPSIRFTKLIIFHLQRLHNFHPRPDSPLHLPTEEPVLGHLKFSAKGSKREVFGMTIPNELINNVIRGADYYDAYLEKVAKHQRYIAGEELSDPESPAPKPPSLIKTAINQRQTSQQPFTKLSSRNEFVDEGVPAAKPSLEDTEEAILQKVLEESLTDAYPTQRGPLHSSLCLDEEMPSVVRSGAQDEGQAGPNPDDVAESLPLPTPCVLAGPNLEHSDVEIIDPSSQPQPEHMDKGFTAAFGDSILRMTKPSEADNEKATADTEAESMVSVTIQQDTSITPPMTSPVIDLVPRPDSPNVHWPLPTTTTTTAAPPPPTTTTTTLLLPPQPQQGSSDSILIKRMGELEQHIADLVEEISSRTRLDSKGNRIHKGWWVFSISQACNESSSSCSLQGLRGTKKSKQDSPNTPPGSPPSPPPPPPPSSGASGASGTIEASDSAQAPPPSSSTYQGDQSTSTAAPSSSKTAASAEYLFYAWTTNLTPGDEVGRDHIPTVNLRQSWWKPLTEDRPATPEPTWTIPSSDLSMPTHNWASALKSTYVPPQENSLLSQTGDMATFMDWYNVSKPLPLGGKPGHVTIQPDFFFNKDLEYLRYGRKVGRPALLISKMKVAYYPDVGLEQLVPDQFWIEEECKYDIAAINLVIRHRVEDFQLGIESYQTQLNLTKPRWEATGFEFKHDYTVIDSPRAVTFRDRYGVQMIMRFNEIHKFSDGTLQQIDEALDYRVKEFQINRTNPGMNTRFWTKKDVDRSKDFMFAIQKRLKTRRIFRNLESFVGGRIREGDYREQASMEILMVTHQIIVYLYWNPVKEILLKMNLPDHSKDGDGDTSFQWSQFTTQYSHLIVPNLNLSLQFSHPMRGLFPMDKLAIIIPKGGCSRHGIPVLIICDRDRDGTNEWDCSNSRWSLLRACAIGLWKGSVLTDPEDQAKMEMETPRSSGVNSPPNAHT